MISMPPQPLRERGNIRCEAAPIRWILCRPLPLGRLIPSARERINNPLRDPSLAPGYDGIRPLA